MISMYNLRMDQLSRTCEGTHEDIGSKVLVSIAIAYIWRESLARVESLYGGFDMGYCMAAITEVLLGDRMLEFTSCLICGHIYLCGLSKFMLLLHNINLCL